MIQIKISPSTQGRSSFVITKDGVTYILRHEIDNPVNADYFHRDITPLLRACLHQERGKVLINDESMNFNIDPVTGAMLCEGKDLISLIRRIQADQAGTSTEEDDIKQIIREVGQFKAHIKSQISAVQEEAEKAGKEAEVSRSQHEENRKNFLPQGQGKAAPKKKSILEAAKERAARIRRGE